MDGQRILGVAENRKGIPYRLDPPPDGVNNLDCSLYVLKTFADAGLPFPPGVRTAEQIRQACEPVALSDVAPGDLLFFEHTYEPDEAPGPDGHIASHIGISLGRGTYRMWDENDGRGNVGITNMGSSYWQPKLLSAGRPKPQVAQPDSDWQRMVVANTEGQGVNVRELPDASSHRLTGLPEGAIVDADGHSWRKVLVGDIEGWVAAEYLQDRAPAEAPPDEPGAPSGHFTAEQVAEVLGAPLANVERHLPTITAALDELGIGDRATTIAALATIGVEVGSFLPIEEYRNADGSIPNYWHSYGGGARYHGRGFIQLTHDYNYRHYGAALGVDLLNDPSLALDPTIAARVLALYFREHGIPEMAALPDWYGIRRAVNGGDNGWQEFADYVDAFEALP